MQMFASWFVVFGYKNIFTPSLVELFSKSYLNILF